MRTPLRTAWLLVLPVLPLTAARAQTTCGTPNGPDLVVAEIGSVVNFAALGPSDAIMFGESTCNLGTAAVQHIAAAGTHPVHVQGLFRYELVNGAGHFEQLGFSWAFHDVTALEQNLCCTCNPVGGGNQGPGCSSVDTATAEALQTSLSKRYDIDAFAGNFPYPFPLPGISLTLSRRLRFAVADVDPSLHPNASFFAESAVVAADDAGAQNALNNASYRPLSLAVSGLEASAAITGTTHREQAAIWAWKSIDSQVDVEVVHVPNEGTFLVGSRATDLGTGLWHYEYAVENLNSDVACGGFHVPLTGVALPVAIEFHDVDHLEPDGPNNLPVDSTDWTPTVTTNEVAWSTVPWSTNPAGNALRFATLFTFRFDIAAPPQLSSVTLDTWKTPGSIIAQAVAPGAGVQLAVPYCFGDGSGVACPCANDSAVGAEEGCLNSLGTGGKLVTSGASSITFDSLVLSGSQMTNASCLYFQGTSQTAGGAGAVFGDGLRCASGAVVRLKTRTNSVGSSQYPIAGDPSVSVRGGCAAGDVRTYQVWYRNAAAFCAPATFNLTNGALVVWAP
jgi:hypothetical protein